MDDGLIALAAEDLVVARGEILAVRGVSIEIPRGGWFGLIGANGSGKTSLLRALAGRLPIRSGRIWLGEVEVGQDRAARARAIGFAPDGTMLPDALSVRELLALAAENAEAALAALGPLREALGIDSLLDWRIGSCSAGMRQRVAIACAFAGGRKLVILDEPFNWLDPLAAYDTRTALKAMVDGGLTLVTALHDLATLAASCDAGALLAGGQVAMRIEEVDLVAAVRDPLGFERETIAWLRGGGG
jgi:ABC-type multidrug transport system ATPase subunit